MKKQLLLAMAVATVATVSAQQTTKSVTSKDAEAVMVEVSDVASASLESAKAPYVAKPATAPALADGDYVPEPFFITKGMFYENVIINGENELRIYNNKTAYYPPFSQLTYENSSYYQGTLSASPVWEWSVPELSEVDLAAGSVKYYTRTSSDFNFATEFKTKYFDGRIALPVSLSMDGTSYSPGVYSQWGGKFGYEDDAAPDGFEKIGLSWYPATNTAAYTACTGNYNICNTLRITNWILNSNYYSDATSPMSVAVMINPAESAVYGFDEVILKAYITNVAAGGKFKVDVFSYTEDQDGYYWTDVYVPNKLLASGYVATDEYAGIAGTSALIKVPIIDVEGEGDDAIETPSFFNVTEPVMVVVSLESAPDAGDEVLPIPVFAAGVNTSRMWEFEQGGTFIYDYETAPGEVRNAFAPSFTGIRTIGGTKLMQLGWDIMFNLRYSYLYEDGVSPELSYDAPADGGSQSFTFTPAEDLYNAKISVSNDDAWLFAYPDADLAEDGTQDLVVDVDPLPAGVPGRAAVLTVEVQGAIQTITVKQGDTSGIDTIEGDNANVVSSQIFDLQGRKLNAVPENGLYIRRDVKADNTVSTVKVVK